jgi:hypothetical protein
MCLLPPHLQSPAAGGEETERRRRLLLLHRAEVGEVAEVAAEEVAVEGTKRRHLLLVATVGRRLPLPKLEAGSQQP